MKNSSQAIAPTRDLHAEALENKIITEACSRCPLKYLFESIAGGTLTVCPPDLILEVFTANLDTLRPITRARYVEIEKTKGKIPSGCPYKQMC